MEIKIVNKIYNFAIVPLLDNGILFGGIILLKRVFYYVYNIIFLKRKHITADFSSDIKGLRYMSIGSVIIGKYCRIEILSSYHGEKFKPTLKIGNRVSMNDMVHIGCAHYIEIGDDCLFASKIYISDHNHGIYKGSGQSKITELVDYRRLDADKKVIIGKNVWLGEGVSVLPGSEIGNNCIIGANAVVVGKIPSNTIAVGIPAKVIKIFDNDSNKWVTYHQ